MAKTETAILGAALKFLRDLVPEGWACELDRSSGRSRTLVVRSPDGATGRVAVVAKARVPPGAIAGLRADLERRGDTAVVLAGWLSPTSRQMLAAQGLGYLDLTGNVDLRLGRPGLFLRVVGADRDPEPSASSLKSLKGAGAARAVRALVDFVPPYGVRELAAASGASAAVVSRVVKLLEGEALVSRDGQITHVEWEAALRRWAEDYALTSSNRVVPCLEPRGLPALLRKLPGYESTWAATGTLGVPPGVSVVPLRLVAIYVPSPEGTLDELGLVAVEAGANVLLLQPPDEGPFARRERGADGMVRCAPSQVAVDLLTGPGRGSAEGAALLGWMRENEAVWRRRP